MVELCGFISYTHRFSDNHDHAGLSRVPLASRRGMEGNKKGEWKEREERERRGWALGAPSSDSQQRGGKEGNDSCVWSPNTTSLRERKRETATGRFV